ncbi:hypothetical protein PV342_32465 [Streptomyces sp. PA03-3a]|nr:hypothetical protein [Streptomyces sp. PA03-3a]
MGGIVGAVLVIGAIGSAIDSGNGTASTPKGSANAAPSAPTSAPRAAVETSASATPMQTPTPTPTPSVKAEPKRATMPNFVGMGLQSAQDAAQEKGFYSLISHDALGRDRNQVFDRNWQVCSQNYKAGKTIPMDTTLDFGAVKLEEVCPATEKKAPAAAGTKMPNFVGDSVNTARAALDSSTSITVADASSDDRMVLLESNWQVCTQSPAAGVALHGQPVAFTAVKFGESCP